MFEGKIILITGGTGSFGNRILKRLAPLNPKEIRIFSRDEKKQYDMKFAYKDIPQMKFFIGDVRDRARLDQAMKGVDIVYHAAALKHVLSCEVQPLEAVKTNIVGAQNVLDSAIANNVDKIICLSTDKAVKPVNAMGMSKALQEKLVIATNDLPQNTNTKCACVRYGNVMGSRGSAIPFFRQLIDEGEKITITDEEMTRFMLTLDDAIDLVFFATEHMKGGETFVKKAPSIKITDLARILYKLKKGSEKDYAYEVIGILPGEKIHEILISEEEKTRSVDKGDFFIIYPNGKIELIKGAHTEYCSDNVITDEDEILVLLERADKSAKEDYYNKSIYVK